MYKISVLMATYNGEKYIYKQLESIYRQTRLPDEVVICDDRSTDSTNRIIGEFIKNRHLSNWHHYINKENLGWRENFFCGTSYVSGDIIFFSDQDDIWHKDKIEKMTSLFKEKNMDGLFCARNIIDEKDNPIIDRIERNRRKKKLEQIVFSPSFYDVKTLGCCECISKKVIDLYKKINMPECGHDSQCGRLALLVGTLWYMDEALIDYRMHSSNSSGISKKGSFGQSSLEKRLRDIDDNVNWLEKIIMMNVVSGDRLEQIKVSYACVKYRSGYLHKNKKTRMIGFLRHRIGYSNLTTVIGDFAYRHNLNEKFGSIRWKINRTFGI